jgi:PAS domain S-box-containing protein
MASTKQNAEQARQAQDVDAIPTLAWSARPDGSAEFLTRRWLEYTGLSAEEASDWGWTAAVHSEDRERLMDFWRHLLASGEAGEIEARLRRYDGDYRWFLFRVEPARDNHGHIFKWYGANADIEDRKRAEALLAAEKRTLEMIASGACLADILESLCLTIDAQARNVKSAVLLMDADGMHLRPAAGPRFPKEFLEAITPLKIGPGVGSCGTAAFLKQRVIVSDIATDPLWADYREFALSYGFRAARSQPLFSKNQHVLGTFGMYYPEVRTPSETDLRLIEGAGHIAVIAIEGERSQEALRSAFEEIRESEAKLQQDERELRQVMDFLPQHVVVMDKDGTLLQANEKLPDYLGLTLEEMKHSGVHERIRRNVHPEDLERFEKGLTPLRNPEYYQCDFDLRDIAEVWRRGSVISSWLLDLTAVALTKDSDLTQFAGRVSDSGEGRWTIKAAVDEGVPVPVLSSSLYARFASRGESDFQNRVLSAMRYAFGGHLEKNAIAQ